MAVRILLTTSLLIQSVMWTSGQYCKKTQYQLSCSKMEIKELHVQLPIMAESRLDFIEILDSNLPTLNESLFNVEKDFKRQMKSLKICTSGVQEIEEHTFKNFDSVHTLDLSKNQIALLNNLCDDMINLVTLNMDFNNLEKISSAMFGNCLKVSSISVGFSGVNNIEKGAFDSFLILSNLNLEGNNIQNLDFFSDKASRSLHSLNVRNNFIKILNLEELMRVKPTSRLEASSNIISDIIPTSVPNGILLSLDLENNMLTRLNKNYFTYFQNLRSLNVSRNPITFIESGTFDMILNNLKIGGPMFGVKVLKEGTFQGLRGLINFDLSNSSIHEIEIKALPNLYVQKVNLSNNYITTLRNGTFYSMSEVVSLNLTGNKISDLESGAFTGLSSLEEIYPRTFLSGLSHLSRKQFEGVSYNYFKNLDLSNLSIVSLSEYTFQGLYGLRYLHLNTNLISSVEQYTFSGMPLLNTLNLTGNPISYIAPKGFSGLDSLMDLYLAHTQIQSLHADVFLKTPKLFRLDLSFGKLNETQAGLFRRLSSLSTLMLNNNSISILRTYTFWGLTSLRLLEIDENPINVVEPAAFLGLHQFSKYKIAERVPRALKINKTETGTFDGLDYIRVMNLSHSNVTTLGEESFKIFKNMQEIHLEFSNISKLPNHSFSFAEVLQCVNLSHNHIATIENFSFTGAKISCLDFSYNEINACAPLGFIESLTHLNVSHNKIEHLSEYSLSGLKYLVTLDLRDNLITRISQHVFRGLTHLSTLLLTGNSIKILENQTFDGLVNVRSLNFTCLEMKKLTENTLEGLPGITELSIKGSKIDVILRHAFNHSTLQTLSLVNCTLKKIEDGAFLGLTNLKKLNLSSSLGLITYISPGVFDGLRSLEYLDLSGGGMKKLLKNTFSELTQLVSLNLRNNKLAEISGEELEGLSSLIELNMAGNSLKSLKTLHHSTKLTNLYLQNNKIVDLTPGIFRGLSFLHTVNLSGNAIPVLDQYVFFNLVRLEKMDISNNQMRCVDMSALRQMRSLKWIGLRGNTWSCKTLYKMLEYFTLRQVQYDTVPVWWRQANVNGLNCNDRLYDNRIYFELKRCEIENNGTTEVSKYG